MSEPKAVPGRSRPVIAIVSVIVALVILVGLGLWQLERRDWKAALNATLAERSQAAPAVLAPSRDWPSLRQDDDEFRRVRLTVTFPESRDAVVYAGGSALRPEIKTPGYFVFSVAQLSDGARIVINRGHAAEALAQARSHARPSGPVEIIGALRWPESGGLFVTPYEPKDDTWFVRDPQGMAMRNGWGDVASFYIEQEAPVPPGGSPRPGPLTVTLRDPHLGYALTWFGLAAVLAVMSLVWLFRREKA